MNHWLRQLRKNTVGYVNRPSYRTPVATVSDADSEGEPSEPSDVYHWTNKARARFDINDLLILARTMSKVQLKAYMIKGRPLSTRLLAGEPFSDGYDFARGGTPLGEIYMQGSLPLIRERIRINAPVIAREPHRYHIDYQGLSAIDVTSLVRTRRLKAPSRSPSRPFSTFAPSAVLVSYLDKEGTGKSLPREAGSHLGNSVVGLFQAIADAHAHMRKHEPFQVTDKGRFVDSVSEALVRTIRFDLYRTKEFLTQVYEELCEVCPLRINGWSLDRRDDGSLCLSIPATSVERDQPEVKATVARSKFGKRFSNAP